MNTARPVLSLALLIWFRLVRIMKARGRPRADPPERRRLKGDSG